MAGIPFVQGFLSVSARSWRLMRTRIGRFSGNEIRVPGPLHRRSNILLTPFTPRLALQGPGEGWGIRHLSVSTRSAYRMRLLNYQAERGLRCDDL